MSKIKGDNPQQRKKSLAILVCEHLNTLNFNARVIENRTNSAGHRDLVVIESDLGLVHITALSGSNPNELIPYQGGDKKWVEEKSFIAVGWNVKGGRTFIFFVPSEHFQERNDLSKSNIKPLCNKELTAIIM
ncbi:MAG: hypothetical protein ABJK37_02160 [Paraglaciecola sp.]|uniref:hypothetical protein n=1 Tax=Paraglaciecola sp. TaxID=1920173 RepID=UPI0032983B86